MTKEENPKVYYEKGTQQERENICEAHKMIYETFNINSIDNKCAFNALLYSLIHLSNEMGLEEDHFNGVLDLTKNRYIHIFPLRKKS